MDDLAEVLRRWQARGESYALATIVEVSGSTPHGIGPALAVNAAGRVAGSVSGGCVDAEVYELCREVLRTGAPAHRCFTADDADPFAPSLTCGGTIEVEVRRVVSADDIAERMADDVADRRPRLLIFGATHFADALAAAGAFLGYRVTVCDARPVFATRERTPDADEVVVDWPHHYLAATEVDSSTAICVLTHDAKFDVPALIAALRSPAGYVGALGSRRTCAERIQRLRDAGLDDAELSRLRSPIGLDLGGTSPKQVALSICAEIVAVAHGGTGRPLRETTGSMHRQTAASPPEPATHRPQVCVAPHSSQVAR
jgi:xanthine dehydrogenase accessory factor